MQNGNDCLEQKTDEELATLSLREEDFYLCLMQRYEAKLKRYIHRISRSNEQDAEDILQEVFLKAYLNLNNFDASLKFSSWIYRITHNEVISAFRRQKARPQTNNLGDNDELLNKLASDLDLTKEIHGREKSMEIKKVLSRLDGKYREVLVLKFLEDKNYAEISDILKKPPGTIATLINRAKKKFKEEALKLNLNF